jgi:hypothetical protein
LRLLQNNPIVSSHHLPRCRGRALTIRALSANHIDQIWCQLDRQTSISSAFAADIAPPISAS